MTAVTKPPAIAPSATWPVVPSITRITITAPVTEPIVNPIMSGLPSGLREMLWKIAPAIPNAAPTRTAVATRGSRSVSTMNSLAGSPWPTRTAMTSPGDSGKSPVPMLMTAASSRAASSTPHTSSERVCTRTDIPAKASAVTAARSASGARAR